MVTVIDGACYAELLNYGIRNMNAYRKALNELNVFPVPDGDTGTNMVMTLRQGFEAVKDKELSLGECITAFASSSVHGARGNSGVIFSQFFKGVSEVLKNYKEADVAALAASLESGSKFAYSSVAQPVEGTMLTVMRDASAAVNRAMPLATVEELVEVYITEAEASLKRTPDLLPILKKAGVVDSGACGVVRFFEGVKKYLKGEPIGEGSSAEGTGEKLQIVDFSLFNKDTQFVYGYCIEGLLQLQADESSFDIKAFKKGLVKVGTSVVASVEKDKVKIHVHSLKLDRVFRYCQKYGEFLTLKVENMTVQNTVIENSSEPTRKFLYNEEGCEGGFAVVAVATNTYMQKKFFEMGADVVILSEIAPSSQDFIDAFELTGSKNILVYPNSSNSILASMQAGSMYKGAKVTVLNSRSLVECYESLSLMDFSGTVEEAVSASNDTISNIYQVSVHVSAKDTTYGQTAIRKNEFFALSDKDKRIVCVSKTVEEAAVNSAKTVLSDGEYCVVTLYYGMHVGEDLAEHIAESINEVDSSVEVALVPTMETACGLIISFE